MSKKKQGGTTDRVGLEKYLPKCIDPEAICAHSFEEDCTAALFKHLCPMMREAYISNQIKGGLGN